MAKYLIGAQQVIQYEFEIEVPDGMTPQEVLKGKCIDHDTMGLPYGYPDVVEWGSPEYIEFRKLEDE